MVRSNTIDIRGLPVRDWGQQMTTLINALEPGESFFVLSDPDVATTFTRFCDSSASSVFQDGIERGPLGWKMRISKLSDSSG